MKAPSEKHLEDWLFEDIERLGMCTSPTIYQIGTLYRQVKMRRGILDLLFVGEDSMTLVELKKGEIDDHALQQILRYMGDLKDTWDEVTGAIKTPNDNSAYNNYPYYGGLSITGILVGYTSNEKTLEAAHGAGIWTFKYEHNEVGEYELDWMLAKSTVEETYNPLEYTDISDAMFRMAKQYIKNNEILKDGDE
jgi:RecB family endonuclease NucS